MIRYLALGDSYTIGEGVEPASRWPNRLAAALRAEGLAVADPEIVATTGWATDELAAGIDAAAPRGRFDLVTLLIGVNDQYRGRATGEFAAGFGALLERAVAFAGGAPERVVVVSIPDWGVTPFAAGRDRGQIAAEIDAFNEAAREAATSCGAAWVDVTALSRAAGAAAGSYVADALHPSPAAYADWTSRILPAARAALRAAAASDRGSADASPAATEHHIRVQRSARWYLLGRPGPRVREIWIVLHGYAQLARDFIAGFAPIATPERLIVAPEALSRFYVESAPGRDHRTVRVGATWMTREDRDAEMLDCVDYLDAVNDRVRGLVAAPVRVTMLGFSQGTATASRSAVLGSARCDRLILWGGGFADELTGEQFAERFGRTPVALVHGRSDRVVPFTILEHSAERLRVGGAAVSVHPFDGGHRLDADVLTALAEGAA